MDIKLPEKSLGIFDKCPRGQEDWLVELLDDYAKKAVEVNLAETSKDSRRCIEARNKLNSALHGEGAVIDDLEHAVANACQRIKAHRAAQGEGEQP